jgi:hypothetical protein
MVLLLSLPFGPSSATAGSPMIFQDVSDPGHSLIQLDENNWEERFGDGRIFSYTVWWLNAGTGPRIGIRDSSRNVDVFLDLSINDQRIEARSNSTNENWGFQVRRIDLLPPSTPQHSGQPDAGYANSGRAGDNQPGGYGQQGGYGHPVSPPPRIQPTDARVSNYSREMAEQVVGLGPLDDAKLATQFRTIPVVLAQDIPMNGRPNPVVLNFNPAVYAWYENGSTYIRVDTHGSRLHIDQYSDSDMERGFFIESVNLTVIYPRSLYLTDIFPLNEMGSTQVSTSRSLSTGVSVGPSTYAIGINSSLTTSNSYGAVAPDFKSETQEFDGQLRTSWRLCAIPGKGETQGTPCVYNGPNDLGLLEDKSELDKGWLSRLATLPSMAKHFSAMRQTFVLVAQGIRASNEVIDFQMDVTLRSVALVRTEAPEVTKPLVGVGRDMICLVDPNSENCKSLRRGEGYLKLHSSSLTVPFRVTLNLDLRPFASVVQYELQQ